MIRIVDITAGLSGVGNVTWSKLGRFRGGGAIKLDGQTGHGWINHTDEYNFTYK